MKEKGNIFRCKCGVDTFMPEKLDKIKCPCCNKWVRANKK